MAGMFKYLMLRGLWKPCST